MRHHIGKQHFINKERESSHLGIIGPVCISYVCEWMSSIWPEGFPSNSMGIKDHVGEIISQESLGVAYCMGQQSGYLGSSPVTN